MRERGTHARQRCVPWIAVALPACALLIALGPDGFPLLSIRAFLLPGAALLLVAGTLLAVRRAPWAVDGALLAALICMSPAFMAAQRTICTDSGTAVLSMAQMNVHQVNTSYIEVVAAARAVGADLLSVQEVDSHWETALVKNLADLYPYHILHVADDNYGIALFSRSPMGKAKVFDLSGLPALRAMVRVGGLDVQVFAVHLRSPEGWADLEQRNIQWDGLSELVKNCSGPVIVVGDLNTVPWDDAAKRFNGNTSMTWGPHPLLPTWPSIAGFSLTPLDHILTSPGLCVAAAHTFLIPGSDHRGLSALIQVDP